MASLCVSGGGGQACRTQSGVQQVPQHVYRDLPGLLSSAQRAENGEKGGPQVEFPSEGTRELKGTQNGTAVGRPDCPGCRTPLQIKARGPHACPKAPGASACLSSPSWPSAPVPALLIALPGCHAEEGFL